MPHPQMGVKHFRVIEAFLKLLPQNMEFFLELRHPEWYMAPNFSMISELCQQYKVGLVITDTAGRRDVIHSSLLTPACFIRFVGNDLHASDYARVDYWIERIKNWVDSGIQNVYFFMHQHEELNSLKLIHYMIHKLNDKYAFNIQSPVFITYENQLF